jgi:hypothetical protein
MFKAQEELKVEIQKNREENRNRKIDLPPSSSEEEDDDEEEE